MREIKHNVEVSEGELGFIFVHIFFWFVLIMIVSAGWSFAALLAVSANAFHLGVIGTLRGRKEI